MPDELTHSEDLSPTGRRRREAILSAALAVAAGRRQRRRTLRLTAATAIAGVVVVAAVAGVVSRQSTPVIVHRPQTPPTTTVAVAPATLPAATQPAVKPSPEPRPRQVVIEVFHTDPTLVARLSVPQTPGGWEVIGTDELLRQLDRIGLAGGVVVRNGKSRVWFRPAEMPHSPG